LNETWTRIEKEGLYYGQCSEICGVGHAFMPIVIKAVSPEAFDLWIQEKGGKVPQKAL
jgi:cytochrome c oxidase subunit 2